MSICPIKNIECTKDCAWWRSEGGVCGLLNQYHSINAEMHRITGMRQFLAEEIKGAIDESTKSMSDDFYFNKSDVLDELSLIRKDIKNVKENIEALRIVLTKKNDKSKEDTNGTK